MAIERLAPDAILEQTGCTGVLAAIQDDPDSPDANWHLADSNNVATALRVSFPTPSTGQPRPAQGAQEFRALVKKQGGSGTPKARIELWEGGAIIRAGVDVNVTSTTGQVIAFTWDATEIATTNGSAVECRVVGTQSGGSPGARAAIDVGAIEWNADTEVAAIQGTLSATLGALTASAAGTVATTGTLSRTLGALTSTSTGTVSVSGTSSATLGSLTVAATGTVGSTAVSGSLAATLGALTATATGAVEVRGTASVSLGAATLAATGSVESPAATGSLSATLGALTSAATGAVAVSGSLAGTLGSLTVDGSGAVGSVPVLGELSATLGTLTVAAAGEVTTPAVTGSLSQPLGALSLASTGAVAVSGALAVTLGALTLTGVQAARDRRDLHVVSMHRRIAVEIPIQRRLPGGS